MDTLDVSSNIPKGFVQNHQFTIPSRCKKQVLMYWNNIEALGRILQNLSFHSSVNVNTGSEFDGSDAGARPDEAISWGKIKPDATPVKVYAEATLVFPLIVAKTFIPYMAERGEEKTEF